ncbi:TPA: hypothetical protein QDB15_000040 [Burkholderia vietnamiensis]|uniref:Uncharacterized protein n=1 Tax=Pandoraea apista TaxID=93218 RepID=A0A5E5P163_9BURK|nr:MULTISPECIES: hypothetical protein [Burkholderiaceae]MCA8206314.1 hypothetical protein [Burkholderia vietnamiensis]VVG70416.1 hypothetical protein PAP18089_01376 [Pandoraea apista]HDR8943112.1 hypothetical protein [Burkholderia vietnamiensis]HDR9116316.1 hypothetical protein [Burkholderia vietnamiensis]HDR9205362.1 hypothetical protein [Burkholderia vietnamiensis]
MPTTQQALHEILTSAKLAWARSIDDRDHGYDDGGVVALNATRLSIETSLTIAGKTYGITYETNDRGHVSRAPADESGLTWILFQLTLLFGERFQFEGDGHQEDQLEHHYLHGSGRTSPVGRFAAQLLASLDIVAERAVAGFAQSVLEAA